MKGVKPVPRLYIVVVFTRVCNLVLVIISNLGPILPRFSNITGFLLKTATPSLFHPSFVVFPLD